jgi:Ca2+-binding EF-hand superfamily protein
MRITRGIALITLCLVAGGALAAQQQEGSGAADKLPGFKEADSNGDGQLTFKEVKELGIKKKTFKEEDLDNDGKLSKYDYKYGIK